MELVEQLKILKPVNEKIKEDLGFNILGYIPEDKKVDYLVYMQRLYSKIVYDSDYKRRIKYLKKAESLPKLQKIFRIRAKRIRNNYNMSEEILDKFISGYIPALYRFLSHDFLFRIKLDEYNTQLINMMKEHIRIFLKNYLVYGNEQRLEFEIYNLFNILGNLGGEVETSEGKQIKSFDKALLEDMKGEVEGEEDEDEKSIGKFLRSKGLEH